jgi:hypothetical protein
VGFLARLHQVHHSATVVADASVDDGANALARFELLDHRLTVEVAATCRIHLKGCLSH